ncbi:hypothetical protein X636_09625 [Pandoraea pnomenusa]|nr:hypothetical protein X636_09625 [Pandoraea pnomenusa]
MKLGRSPVPEIANLLVWFALLVLQATDGLADGFATVYLPISLTLLLLRQLASKRPAFDLSVVFLASCLFFFSIGIILWPFSSLSPIEFASLVTEQFTWQQLDDAAIWIGLSIAITMATLMILWRTARHKPQPVTVEFLRLDDPRAKGLYRLGVFCILISLPAVTVELINQWRFIQSVGYLALFSEGIAVSASSKAFLYVFNLGFGLTLAFAKRRMEFLLPAALFLAVATIDSLKGARGALLVPLLFVAWFYVSRFNIRVRLPAVVMSLAVVVAVFAVLTFQRDSSFGQGDTLQFAIDALASQGRSLQITVLYQQVADDVARFGDFTVFSNLLIPITAILHPEIRDAAQSMDQVIYSNNLKHILTYVLNPDYYFAGGGTGGVYTIELIEAGGFLYVLLSITLGWFLAWMPRAMRKPWVRFLSIYFFSTVFYLPRGEFFVNSLIVGKALFLYMVVVGMYRLFRPHKRPPSVLQRDGALGSDARA